MSEKSLMIRVLVFDSLEGGFKMESSIIKFTAFLGLMGLYAYDVKYNLRFYGSFDLFFDFLFKNL